jgi:hypothetical protein
VRRCRVDFDKQIGLLVALLLGEHDVACDVKAGLFPRRHKKIDPVPRIKTQARAAVFEHAVHFGECRVKPRVIVIVADLTPIAVLVVHKVRRIGEDQVARAQRQILHDLDAIALRHVVQHW